MRFVVPAVVLIAVLLGAGAWSYAQAVMPQPVTPVVLSGNDLGFRMEARKGEKAVGRFVVRVDGRWVEIEFAAGIKPVTIK